ncbi:MAG: hypothetical protein WAS23_06610, partial [Dokdonella sp.]
ALLSGDARLIYDSLNLKTSLEEHMRGSRRHAIAHGEYSTSIDPDDVPSIRNTRFELPLIAQLAEIAIAQRFDLHHCAEMATRARAGIQISGWTPVTRMQHPWCSDNA